jgi:hypothetical protein
VGQVERQGHVVDDRLEVRAAACADAVPALADLVLDTLDGLLLDRMTGPDPGRADAALEAFAGLLDAGRGSDR